MKESTGEFACPHCGQAVALALAATTAQRVTCPHCGGEFVAPAADGSTELLIQDDDQDDEQNELEEPPDVPEEALSAIRIRQIAAGRRATYRARSYCVIAAAVCVVATAQLIWMIVQQFRLAGWGMQCSGYALFALLGVQGVFYFAVRAVRLHREAKQSSLIELTRDPDFSTLDNGSNRVQNLEEMR